MVAIRIDRHIEAPPEEVFAAASDFEHAAEVIDAIRRVEMLTEGPVGKGTRFRETRVMFGREASEEMEVTEFEPPHRYVLGCENHGCRYRSEISVTPAGSGTDVSMTFEAEPLTAVAKILGIIFRPMMKKMAVECGKDLDALKRSIERRSAPEQEG